jgi:hypothetical protein
MTAPTQGMSRLTLKSLKTSAEPTFIRAKAPTSFSTNVQPLPALPRSIQTTVESTGIPNDLDELDLLVETLAQSLQISRSTGYLDMYGGYSFDLQKEMMLHTKPLRRRDGQHIDYSGMLLGLLNAGEETGKVHIKDGGEG